MIDIKRYFPKIYNGILEIEKITEVENELFNEVEKETHQFLLNQFVATCKIERIIEFERLLNIQVDNEPLEFRRERIINRLSLTPPFSLPFLRNKLDILIGTNKYDLYMDYDNYILYVETTTDQHWLQELYITINSIKPANIVFINKPRSNEKILVNELVECTKRIYNYRVGAWLLGKFPFSRLGDKEVFKMPDGKSINNNLINDLKNFTVQKINHALVNGKTKITEFLFKGIKDNKINIEYNVNETMGITEIKKIELCDSSDRVLSSIDLYVPVVNGLEMKHVINLEEGIN